jgi:hypothetical protein
MPGILVSFPVGSPKSASLDFLIFDFLAPLLLKLLGTPGRVSIPVLGVCNLYQMKGKKHTVSRFIKPLPLNYVTAHHQPQLGSKRATMRSALGHTLKVAKGIEGLSNEDVRDIKAIYKYKCRSDGTIEPPTAFKIWNILGLAPKGHELIGVQALDMDKFLRLSGAINKRNFDEELNHLHKIFRIMDHQSRGTVTRQGLEAMLISCGQRISQTHLDTLMDKIDRHARQRGEAFTQKQFVAWMTGERKEVDPEAAAAAAEKALLRDTFKDSTLEKG